MDTQTLLDALKSDVSEIESKINQVRLDAQQALNSELQKHQAILTYIKGLISKLESAEPVTEKATEPATETPVAGQDATNSNQ